MRSVPFTFTRELDPRVPSFFARTFCEIDGLPGQARQGRLDGSLPAKRAAPKSPPPSRPRTFPPKPLVLPRKPAGGDAHDLLRVGDGGADHLRRAAVSFEDCKRALGGVGVDHVA